MNIIILGAGQVGGTLAENLVRENNDITLVDTDAERLYELQQRLDIRTIVGHASHPNVIEQAGGHSADMIIAVTNSDETNLVGCHVAATLFSTPYRIARIRSDHYLEHPELFGKKGFPINICISPEQLITNYVHRLIEFPGALQVLDFADSRVQLVAVKPFPGGPMVGCTVRDLHDKMPDVEMRIAAIYRNGQSIALTGSTVMEVGDEVFFIATPVGIKQILKALGRLDNPYKRIMIAGGGNIGRRLARALENDYRVTLVEHLPARAQQLSEELNNTTVLLGDASDRELLINENIEYVDVFIAVTNDDEANIMSCLQAKRLGTRQVMALINRTAYADLVQGGMIDVVISPQQATISSILTLLRRGDMVKVHSLRRGAAEAIEVIAHGDEETSKVVGKKIREIKLPSGTVFGAIVRNKNVIIANEEITIEADDHIILFVINKKHLHEVQQLFSVSLTYS